MLANQKQIIRKRIRTKRLALDDNTAQKHSRTICQKLIALPKYQHAQHIAAYLPFQNEIDLTHFLQQAWDDHKTIYLPRITNIKNNCMAFYPYHRDTTLKPNQYNILEPALASQQVARIAQLDMMIMPLVAFDDAGNRLGQGAGYYDNYLKKAKTENSTLLLIGVGYKFQKVDTLPTDSWDIQLDGVITE